MEKQLDIKTREEIIQAKIIDQDPLSTIVTTLKRIEDLEDLCYMMKTLIYLFAVAAVVFMIIVWGVFTNSVGSALITVGIFAIPAYLGLRKLDRLYKEVMDEYQEFRSQV